MTTKKTKQKVDGRTKGHKAKQNQKDSLFAVCNGKKPQVKGK